MQTESAIVGLLSAQARAWRTRFPGLSNRAHQTIVGYLCTRGRAGVPVRQIYGATKELFLLDDATVRERVEDIEKLGLCEATPKEERLSGRTIVAPTPRLLAEFDDYLLAIVEEFRTAMRAIDPMFANPGPTDLTERERLAILQVFDAYGLAWLAAADQFLTSQNLSPARRTEARRRLTSTSYWTVLARAIEHADQVRRGVASEDSLQADQLAANVLDQTGQSFQTIRDHISWLIAQGLLDRGPGRVLRVVLAAEAQPHFDTALRQTAAELGDAVRRLGMGQAAATASWSRVEAAAEQTVRMRRADIDAGPRIEHWIEVVHPPEAATRVALSSTPVVIGRARPARMLLPDASVSRSHCQVAIEGDGAVVSDLGSTNGTFVDGQKITAESALAEGMELRVGPYRLVYKKEIVGAS